MKKKKTLSALCSLLLTLSLTPMVAAAQPAAQTADDSFKPVLRFAVISDLHIARDRSHHVFSSTFPKTMKTLYEISSSNAYHKTLDAVVFSGDLVDFGTKQCYDLLKEAFDQNIHKDETQILACMGNHEMMENISGSAVTVLPGDTDVINFKEALGYDDIDNHFVINGYHFILSSLLYRNGYQLNRNRDWVDEQLKIAAADGADKPIFTFNHFPLIDTVVGTSSKYEHNHELLGARCEELYKNYPQIVNFTGHSHSPLSYPNIILQEDFTNVAAGCIDRTDLQDPFDIKNGYYSHISHNHIVEVDAENTVRIYPYDFRYGCYLTEEPIEIKNPSDKSGFVYTKEYFEKNYSEQSVFAEDAKIDAVVHMNSIDFSFPQATLNDTLYSYQCTVKRNGKIVQTCKLNSFAYMQYLKNGMPVELVKNKDQLTWTYAGYSEKAVSGKGFFYSDYLKLILFTKLTGNNEYAVYARIADVIQANMGQKISNNSGFVMKKANVYYSAEANLKVEPLMLNLPLTSDYSGSVSDGIIGQIKYKAYKGY